MRRRHLGALFSVGCLALLTAACAKDPQGTPTSVPTGPRSIDLTADMDATTAHAPEKDLVRLTLPGTSWVFAQPEGTALVAVGTPTITAGADCATARVGEGCGSVTMTYRAVATGTSVLAASRTTCGEARRCVGADASYTITVKTGHD
jgi:hypothetical protein